MVHSDDEIQVQLAALRTTYATQLHTKLRQVELLWQRYQASEQRDEILATLLDTVHRLSGSGATFGFSGLSKAAQNLELALRLLAPSEPGHDNQQRRADELVQALLQSVEQPDNQDFPAVHALAAGTSNIANGRQIFLFADDLVMAKDLAAQIGYFGYTVRFFIHHADLAAAVRLQQPAAIVIDTALSQADLSDAQAIYTLQQDYAQEIPVVFISAHGDLMARLSAVRAGGKAYLTKPVDIGSLVEQLDILTDARVQEPYRILIVEDSRQLARYYTIVLEHAGMVTLTVTNPLEVMQPLNEFRPDLILMDVYMPGCSGLDLAKVIRQQEAFLGTPIVFLSAETNLNRQLAAMSLGGDDFLTKPIKPDHLVSAVASRAERSRMLRSFMVRDSLTGLLNHTATKEQLDRELARAMRNGSSLSLAMIDIDRFKQVNDTYGHLVGDQVLKSLSRLLRQRLRQSDIVGRYGGEEFAVILPDTDGYTALAVLDAIREGFGQIRQRAGQQTFAVSFSCGIADFPSYSNTGELIDGADRMLYEVKARGRNQVLLQLPGGDPAAVQREMQPRTL